MIERGRLNPRALQIMRGATKVPYTAGQCEANIAGALSPEMQCNQNEIRVCKLTLALAVTVI